MEGEIYNMSTCGVIVTYNRNELLINNIKANLKQIVKLDKIIVIDNGSDDIVSDFLAKQKNIDFVEVVRLDKNIGCSGAFALGMRTAFEKGFEWVYMMDDDGMPSNEYTIKELLDYLHSNKISSDNKVIANSFVCFNEKEVSIKVLGEYDIEKIIKN